jgi:hypothetical protein
VASICTSVCAQPNIDSAHVTAVLEGESQKFRADPQADQEEIGDGVVLGGTGG